MGISKRKARIIRDAIDTVRMKVVNKDPFVEVVEGTPGLWDIAFARTRDRFLGRARLPSERPTQLPSIPGIRKR